MPESHIEPFGGAIYSGGPFGKEMTSHYYPLENMQASVDFLKQRTDIDIRVMEYGQYQPLLAPMAVAGKKGPKFWWTECGFARIQLSNQANTQPLCNDEPNVVPLTRCGLLDACVRKCFNSEPPICMNVSIIQKEKDAAQPQQHDIVLEWQYEADGVTPKLLLLTMVCPYVERKSKHPKA